jgi:transcriptional regulator with XRE-family HTH domain
VDNRDEAREFLTSRRARITPEQAGLAPGSNRRVPGLRRSEVALLANVSVEYYAQLERGMLTGVSEAVLDAVADTLRLDDAERTYLFDLAKAAGNAPRTRHRGDAKRWAPRASLRQMLNAIDAPAVIRNSRLDLLDANPLGRAFYDEVFEQPAQQPNLAGYVFLDARATRFYADWEQAADVTAAILRAEAGRDPHDKGLHDLIGELSTRSEEFRRRWAARNVRNHGSGTKRFHHRVVGELELLGETLELTSDPGLILLVYTPEPASASDERLRLLASWAGSGAPVGRQRSRAVDQDG